MKIFVTGATGFIGSHLVNQAVELGYEVVALKHSEESVSRVSPHKDIQWITSGLDEIEKKNLEGVDAVVHLAVHSANVPYDTLENCLIHNVVEPLKFFRLAKDAGVRRYVVAGSSFEYGKAALSYDEIPPDAPLLPTQTYPASKAASAVAFQQFAQEYKLKLSYHRIFQVFGEGEPEGRLWPSLKKAAESGEDYPMTGGEQIRDFIPVESVAAQLLQTLSREDVKEGEPVIENLGSGSPQQLIDFVKHWWTEWGGKGKILVGELPYREGEVMKYVPEI